MLKSPICRPGQWGSEAQCILDKEYESGAHFSLFAAPFFSDSEKMHPSTAGLTERHFQSPAERSQIRTRNLLYYNRASLITWDCASEIN